MLGQIRVLNLFIQSMVHSNYKKIYKPCRAVKFIDLSIFPTSLAACSSQMQKNAIVGDLNKNFHSLIPEYVKEILRPLSLSRI